MLSKPITERLQWFERLAQQHIVTQHIEDDTLSARNIRWDILRTDLIHPVCSGNKFFKLKYYLLDAMDKKHTSVTTYGGAWSNHIVASAFAAAFCGLGSKGIIRGEKPVHLSETLFQSMEEGMELEFISRQEFAELSLKGPGNSGEYIIPQGGFGPLGVKGAAEIMNYAMAEKYSHIFCAVGTGTMLAGLITAFGDHEPGEIPHFIGIPVLNDTGLGEKIDQLIRPSTLPYTLLYDFHFGGYAKKTAGLIQFMNRFFEKYQVPTDFVYTGKLMFGIQELVNSGYFQGGSRILAVHSGGLQGNKSLKKGTLIY
jgi:1-aminocyclopropane-1-carboxylate deaminase